MKSLVPAVLLVALVGCGEELTFDSPDAAPDAAAQDVELAAAPADWLFLFDRSASWSQREDRFDGLKDGVSGFLAVRTADIELAATYFPRAFDANPYCEVADYAMLEVPWSATNAEVSAGFAEWDITSHGSALGPALAGAGVLAGARRAARPGRSTSIVLLTDASPGEDELCETSEWSAVATIAGDVFDAGRGPSIHVVSVMGTAIPVDHPTKVGGIAIAGGGYAAFVNGSQSDVAGASEDALLDLEARAAICTRAVPAGFVPSAITVTSPDGAITELARVADASACQGDTFYLDDPVAPTTATLCSGGGGVGGVCERTFVRARLAGVPTFNAR